MIYKFKVLATNSYGDSDLSEELNAGIGSYPAKPNKLRQVISQSSETQITLEWDTCPDTELRVISYTLLMNNGMGGNTFTPIYTNIYPNLRTFTVTNLTTSFTYKF